MIYVPSHVICYVIYAIRYTFYLLHILKVASDDPDMKYPSLGAAATHCTGPSWPLSSPTCDRDSISSTLTVPSSDAANTCLPPLSRVSEFMGYFPASMVPSSATMRISHTLYLLVYVYVYVCVLVYVYVYVYVYMYVY
jgi:hypothetical protein